MCVGCCTFHSVVEVKFLAYVLNVRHCYVDNSQFWCQVSSVVHKRFVSKLSICRPNLYWPMLLVSCTIVSWKRQLQNCLDNALAALENWLKEINIQNLTIWVTSNKIYYCKYRLWQWSNQIRYYNEISWCASDNNLTW